MRTFFAVTPDVQTSIKINDWVRLCWPALSKPVAVQNYHVTLAFLGETSADQLLFIEEALEDFQSASFDLALTETGYWSESDVLWLAPVTVPEPLQALADKCKRVANRAGIRVSQRRYQPHLTLARKHVVPPSMPLIEPEFEFRVESFQLVRSFRERTGVRYNDLMSWPLV
jgi:2'-5' RNA ligase